MIDKFVRLPNRLAHAAWARVSARLRGPAFPYLERAGIHVTSSGFNSPSPDTRDLTARNVWQRESAMPGIDMRESEQIALLARFARLYRDEYAALAADRSGRAGPVFRMDNGYYESVDAEVLYCFVRDRKPRRILEVGSGNSTLLSVEALERNRAEGRPGELTAIDPDPRLPLREGLAGTTRLLEQFVQDVPLAEFEALEAGDILFIDSSHIVKTGSDVCYEFLEILPRLRVGVAVHVHDVFLPCEYPREWIVDNHFFWNEQYLLQAFLIGNASFQVRWAGRYMHHRHPDLLRAAFDSYPGRRSAYFPSSIWLERVA